MVSLQGLSTIPLLSCGAIKDILYMRNKYRYSINGGNNGGKGPMNGMVKPSSDK